MLTSGASEPQTTASLNWYRCNTHTHTSARPQSDANGTPEFAVEWYRAHGYHCLVITDHEFLTDVAPLNEKYGADNGFLVLRGQEITQLVADASHPNGVRHGHINGIGTQKLILPIGHPKPATDVSLTQAYERNISAIHAAGGIAQINHPNLHWSVRLDDLAPLDEPYLLEVWNSFASANNLGGVDESGNSALSPEALWDALLTQGKRVWAVASDDTHEYYKFDDPINPTPGKGWIVVRAASLTATDVMNALRNGQFYASTGIVLNDLRINEREVALDIAPNREWVAKNKGNARVMTRFIGEGGRLLAQVPGLSPRYMLKGDERYVRASIIDSDGRRAWTQPLLRTADPTQPLGRN